MDARLHVGRAKLFWRLVHGQSPLLTGVFQVCMHRCSMYLARGLEKRPERQTGRSTICALHLSIILSPSRSLLTHNRLCIHLRIYLLRSAQFGSKAFCLSGRQVFFGARGKWRSAVQWQEVTDFRGVATCVAPVQFLDSSNT